MSSVLRLYPEDLRATASALGGLSDDTTQVSDQLVSSWSRLDSGWEWYAEEDIAEYFHRARCELELMAEMLEQMGQALVETANLIETADQAAVALFVAPPPLPPGYSGINPSVSGLDIGLKIFYKTINGRPFIKGQGDDTPIHPSDITQGGLGDCYFLSSLAALALTARGRLWIESNLRTNDDGTYTVIFYERDKSGKVEQVPVKVTPDFPMTDDPIDPNTPKLLFAKNSGDTDAATGQQELWVLLYEKAYAQYCGGYRNIHGGFGSIALEALTGQPSKAFVIAPGAPAVLDIASEVIDRYHLPVNITPEELDRYGLPGDIQVGMEFDELADRLEAGQAITVASWLIPDVDTVAHPTIDVNIPIIGSVKLRTPDPATWISPVYNEQKIHTSHEYYVTDVDRTNKAVYLWNPHGSIEGYTKVSWEEFRKAFPFVEVNPIVAPPEEEVQ